jgi:hypothetical protein
MKKRTRSGGASDDEDDAPAARELEKMARVAAKVGAVSAAAAGAGPAYMARQARQASRMGPQGSAVLPTIGLTLGLPFVPYRVSRDAFRQGLVAELTTKPPVQRVTLNSLVKLVQLPRFWQLHKMPWYVRIFNFERKPYLKIDFDNERAARRTFEISSCADDFERDFPKSVVQKLSALAVQFQTYSYAPHALNEYLSMQVYRSYSFEKHDPIIPTFLKALFVAAELQHPFVLTTTVPFTSLPAALQPPGSNILDFLNLKTPVPAKAVQQAFANNAMCVYRWTILTNTTDRGSGSCHYENDLDDPTQAKGLYESLALRNHVYLRALVESARELNVKTKQHGVFPQEIHVSGLGSNVRKWLFDNVLAEATTFQEGLLSYVFKFAGATREEGTPGPLNASSRIVQSMAAQARVTPDIFLSYFQ